MHKKKFKKKELNKNNICKYSCLVILKNYMHKLCINYAKIMHIWILMIKKVMHIQILVHKKKCMNFAKGKFTSNS